MLVDGLPFTINDPNGSGGGSPSTFYINYVDGVVNVAVETRNNTDEFYLLASQDNGGTGQMLPLLGYDRARLVKLEFLSSTKQIPEHNLTTDK